MQRRAIRKIVSHTFGWFKEFLAVPKITKTTSEQNLGLNYRTLMHSGTDSGSMFNILYNEISIP